MAVSGIGSGAYVALGATVPAWTRGAAASPPADPDPAPTTQPADPTRPSSGTQQALADVPKPAGVNGWSPSKIVPVHSRNTGGIVGSVLQFALGGVTERPGQRLSTAQIDAIAPYYAEVFGLDEGYVRGELGKVYFYVGGPSSEAGGAMTIGHHVFVPTENALFQILGTDRSNPNRVVGKRWLVHELAHTMQFLANEHGSPHSFLAEYISALTVGHNPDKPGSGDGPLVWGSIFTGIRSAGKSEDELGSGSTTLGDRMTSSLLPASVLGLAVGLTATGAVSATRKLTGQHLFGHGRSMRVGLGLVTAPAVAGALVGAYEDKLGKRKAQALGAAVGGALAGVTLWRSGAFHVGGTGAATQLGHNVGRGIAIGGAVLATIMGALISKVSEEASATTIAGWSSSASLLTQIRHRDDAPGAPASTDILTYSDTVHDAHWFELDAETIAKQYTSGGWTNSTPGTPITGRVPKETTGLVAASKVSDRIDWGIKIPLLVGVPAAAGLGSGVMAWRTGGLLFDATVRDGRGPVEAVREAVRQLTDVNRGVRNSYSIGASVTIAPLVFGGLIAPVVYNVTGSSLLARLGGAASGAVVTGALLTMLLRGRGSGMIATSGKVVAGMVAASGVGLLAGGIATDALRAKERMYDVSRGSTARLPRRPRSVF